LKKCSPFNRQVGTIAAVLALEAVTVATTALGTPGFAANLEAGSEEGRLWIAVTAP